MARSAAATSWAMSDSMNGASGYTIGGAQTWTRVSPALRSRAISAAAFRAARDDSEKSTGHRMFWMFMQPVPCNCPASRAAWPRRPAQEHLDDLEQSVPNALRGGASVSLAIP